MAANTSERVGEAWKQHRMGNNNSAIDIFRDVLGKNPGDLDALYGLGLALRADGNADEAVESFNKAMQITEEALEAGAGNIADLDTYEDDRYLMLQRMISQRLEELEVEA